MGILVLYDDNLYDVVNDEHLDYLIAAHRIIGFRRSSEWVMVGSAPLRGAGGDYLGKDRRSGVGRKAISQA
jgi:hypothetical protein